MLNVKIHYNIEHILKYTLFSSIFKKINKSVSTNILDIFMKSLLFQCASGTFPYSGINKLFSEEGGLKLFTDCFGLDMLATRRVDIIFKNKNRFILKTPRGRWD